MPTKIRISGEIYLFSDFNKLINQIKAANTWPNPSYLYAKRCGFKFARIPQEIFTFRTSGDWLVLPRGYWHDLIPLLPKNSIIEDWTIEESIFFPELSAKLRSYQQHAVDVALQYSQGIICAPTGSGKTIIALALLAKLQQRAIVLVHNKELAKQWIKVINHQFGIHDIGFIGDGYWREGNIITIAMMQTLHKNLPATSLMARQYGVIIVDECHHAPASTFASVIALLPAKYRFGLSATPTRRDDMDILINRVMGRILVTIDKSEVEEVGATVPVSVKVIKTDFIPTTFTNCWGHLVTAITNSEERNELIVSLAQEECQKAPVLVLVDRITHAENLMKLVSVPTILIHGMLPPRDFKLAISQISSATLTIGTIAMLGEGLDIARWGTLILATPISTKVRLLQVIGRIVRPFPGKRHAHVFDLVDSTPFAVGSFKKRKKIYHEQKIRYD